MIRDSILKTKRDELTNCITSRKRKLQELYYATVSFASGEPSHHHGQYDGGGHHFNGEAKFLDANNISEGRFFDFSTLPLVDLNGIVQDNFSSPRLSAIPTSTSVRHDGSNTLSLSKGGPSNTKSPQDVTARTNGTSDFTHGLRTQRDKHVSSASMLSKATQASFTPTSAKIAIADSQLTKDSLLDAPSQTYIGRKEPLQFTDADYQMQSADSFMDMGVASPKATQSSEDRTIALDSSAATTSTLNEAQIYVGSDKLGAKTSRKPHLEQAHDISTGRAAGSPPSAEPLDMISKGIEQKDDAIGHDKEYFNSDDVSKNIVKSTNRTAEPESQILGHPSGVHDKDDPNVQSDSEKSSIPQKTKVDGTRAFVGPPSTPDAQLKFEEAQSMSASERHPLPSAHIQDHSMSTLQSTRDTHSYSEQKIRLGIGDDSMEMSNAMDIDQMDCSRSDGDDQRPKERRGLGSQERRLPGMTRDMSKDLMFSQRPPIRIDTKALPPDIPQDAHEKVSTQNHAKRNDICNVSSPVKAAGTGPTSPPERMTTRVSSGALRHKSVSEILGETPKHSIHTGDRTPIDKGSNDLHRDDPGLQTPGYGSLVMSPDSMSFRSRLSELREREKERSKLSTVVFARQQPADTLRGINGGVGNYANKQDSIDEPKDYLLSLFAAQASTQSPALNALLSSAHKTLTTSNHYLYFHEQQDCRIMKRIYQLQNSNRWSLRQLERSVEPQRPMSHWDALLGHMKWMRTDFREERKWKLTTAKNLVDWCAEWVLSPVDRRVSLQVRIRKPPHKTRASIKAQITKGAKEANLVDDDAGSLHPESPPELISSAGDDSSDAMDETLSFVDITRAGAPAAIFSLAPEHVLFGLDRTPMSDKLLSELPLYQPWKGPQDILMNSSHNLSDNSWKLPVIPISKFAIGKMVIREEGPARKKSRYDYAEIDANEHNILGRSFLASDQGADPLPPEKGDVGLFSPEFKHIRDRIHAGHAFRPPSEHVMPFQSFFECRQSSQWTWPEDDELRRLVREYAYNWSLISSYLSSPSVFSSGTERRTPWECFERWIALESLPHEMSKTQYFRAYNARLEAAQQTLAAQHQAAQQQQGANAFQLPIRRKTSTPIRVDRRRNNKHLALVHAMQKLAKKKEVAIQKQQHVASLAAMRKANEATQPRQAMRTPREFSRFKHERESKMQERQEAYRLQVLAQQRAAQVQKTSQQVSQQQAGSSLSQASRNAVPSTMNGNSPRLMSHQAHFSNSTRAPPSSQSNGSGMNQNIAQAQNAQMGARVVVPQAQMQSNVPGQQRMPPQITNDMRIYMEATRQQDQQRYLQQQQQQQRQQQQQQHQSHSNGHNGTSSSPSNPNLNGTSQINNAAVLANLQATNGIPSPAANGASGTLPGSSGSPRLASSMQAQGLSSGMVPAVNTISREIKLRHPQASPEQVSKMTTESLNQYRMNHSQAAMAAAVGNSAANNIASGLQVPLQQQAMLNGVNSSSMMNPSLYAQMMRSQQSTQQSRNGSNGVNGVRPPSRGATPQVHRNSNGQVGPNQSPRPPQAQMAGAQ